MPQFEIDQTLLHWSIATDTAALSPIASRHRAYEIQYNAQPPETLLETLLQDRKEAVCLFDEKVYRLYFPNFSSSPFQCIQANEHNKSIDSALSVCHFLESHSASKGCEVFVIGGGIIQDIGGLACALYKRGIQWDLLPTTLLAQADSCIGGKTSLNFQKSKNILGLFSAPSSVIINAHFLKSLPPLEICSGLGEIFKSHLIGGSQATALFETHLNSYLQGNQDALKQLILNALAVKKAIIEHDEFEKNIRKSLNYGHSVGHALESLSDYTLPHGIAITIGILIENEFSKQLGHLDPTLCNRIKKIALSFIPNTIDRLPALQLDRFLAQLNMDKKTVNTQLELPCLMELGKLCFEKISLESVNAARLGDACETIFNELLGHSTLLHTQQTINHS